jgi:hypothetical protein
MNIHQSYNYPAISLMVLSATAFTRYIVTFILYIVVIDRIIT